MTYGDILTNKVHSALTEMHVNVLAGKPYPKAGGWVCFRPFETSDILCCAA